MKKLKTLKDLPKNGAGSDYSGDWSIDYDDLQEVAKEWIKYLDKPTEIYGIPLITVKLKELPDKEFIQTYNLHMRTSAQNILRYFFNLGETE